MDPPAVTSGSRCNLYRTEPRRSPLRVVAARGYAASARHDLAARESSSDRADQRHAHLSVASRVFYEIDTSWNPSCKVRAHVQGGLAGRRLHIPVACLVLLEACRSRMRWPKSVAQAFATRPSNGGHSARAGSATTRARRSCLASSSTAVRHRTRAPATRAHTHADAVLHANAGARGRDPSAATRSSDVGDRDRLVVRPRLLRKPHGLRSDLHARDHRRRPPLAALRHPCDDRVQGKGDDRSGHRSRALHCRTHARPLERDKDRDGRTDLCTVSMRIGP